MSDMNQANLTGNLGKDPESSTMANGDEVVSFSLASDESWTDKVTGAKKTVTEWHSIVIYNQQIGQLALRYLRKGSKCRVMGKIQYRKWQDKTGADRWSTDIVLQKFGGELQFLDGRQDEAAQQRESRTGKDAAAGGSVHDDDEVPF